MQFWHNLVVQEINLMTKRSWKSEQIQFHHLPPCFIYISVEHKIYDCPHKDAAHAMFKEKVAVATPNKDDVVVNMVLTITTRNQIPKKMVFKEKYPFQNKCLANWQQEEKLQCLFLKAIKDIQYKKILIINIQTLVKANFTNNFNLDTENKSIGPTGFIRSIGVIDFIGSIKILMSMDLPKITN